MAWIIRPGVMEKLENPWKGRPSSYLHGISWASITTTSQDTLVGLWVWLWRLLVDYCSQTKGQIDTHNGIRERTSITRPRSTPSSSPLLPLPLYTQKKGENPTSVFPLEILRHSMTAIGSSRWTGNIQQSFLHPVYQVDIGPPSVLGGWLVIFHQRKKKEP